MKKADITAKDNIEVEIPKEEFVEEEIRPSVSSYAKFFNETCVGWCKDSECNLMFLKVQENYANEKLRARGYLFLNDVYDMLGMPRTKAGQIIGWIYDEKNPLGDNYVDFGIYAEHNMNFVNGYESSVLLDFNVDGMILDRLPDENES